MGTEDNIQNLLRWLWMREKEAGPEIGIRRKIKEKDPDLKRRETDLNLERKEKDPGQKRDVGDLRTERGIDLKTDLLDPNLERRKDLDQEKERRVDQDLQRRARMSSLSSKMRRMEPRIPRANRSPFLWKNC